MSQQNAMSSPALRRDTIVVGASSGGVAALTRLLEQLPAELAAAVFIVQHQSPRSPGQLASVLQAAPGDNRRVWLA